MVGEGIFGESLTAAVAPVADKIKWPRNMILSPKQEYKDKFKRSIGTGAMLSPSSSPCQIGTIDDSRKRYLSG